MTSQLVAVEYDVMHLPPTFVMEAVDVIVFVLVAMVRVQSGVTIRWRDAERDVIQQRVEVGKIYFLIREIPESFVDVNFERGVVEGGDELDEFVFFVGTEGSRDQLQAFHPDLVVHLETSQSEHLLANRRHKNPLKCKFVSSNNLNLIWKIIWNAFKECKGKS